MNRSSYSDSESSNISPLDSWFRRQGGPSSTTLRPYLVYDNVPSKLPRIRESVQEWDHTSSNIRTNHRSHHFNSHGIDKHKGHHLNNNSSSHHYRSKTPNASFFYQKCIDEVTESNHPNDMEFRVPRELAYVRSIPYMRYVTYGTGNCNDSVWQLEISAQ